MYKFQDKTSLNVSRVEGSIDTGPRFLTSVIKEEKWDKVDFPALPYCADEAPYLGSLQGTHGGCLLEKKDSSLSKKWDEKGHYLQDCTRRNDLQCDRLHHKKRRIMVYLCGGYKGEINSHLK